MSCFSIRCAFFVCLASFFWGCGGDAPLASAGGEDCVGESCGSAPDVSDSSPVEDAGSGEDEDVVVLPPPPTNCDENTDCDDFNECTSGACFDGKCVYTDLSSSCDDGDLCTANDVCANGICSGAMMDCDPGQTCLVGTCNDGVCGVAPSAEDVCDLKLEVTSPQRAASVIAVSPITLTGKITSPASPDVTLSLNGEAIGFGSDGSFSHDIYPHLGINIIELLMTDGFDREVRAARSFLYAQDYAEPGSLSDPEPIPGCCGIWLAEEAFDDDDVADLDDVATAVHVLVSTFDINSVIPKPIEHSVLGCTYEISISDVDFVMGPVDLIPVEGGLRLRAQLNNLDGDVDIEAGAICGGDQAGTIKAQIMVIEAEVRASVDPFQDFDVDLESIEVKLVEADANFDEGALSWLNWFTNWFEDSLAGYVVGQVETWMLENVSPLLTEVLNDLADYELTFDAPSIGSDGGVLPLGLDVSPIALVMSEEGAAFDIEIGVGADKGTTYTAPGSVLRGFCPHGESTKPTLPRTSVVEGYLHEDIVNQAFFMLWWGGLTKFSVGPEIIGQYVTGFDLSDLYVDIDPMLPPVVTSCNPEGQLEAQLGDLYAKATFGFLEQQATLEFYASARGSASFKVEEVVDAPNYLALQLDDIDQLAIEVIAIDGLDPIKKSILSLMLSDAVVEVFINQFLAGIAGSYPIPNVDLSPWVDESIHEKPILRLEMETLQFEAGYVLLGGRVLNY